MSDIVPGSEGPQAAPGAGPPRTQAQPLAPSLPHQRRMKSAIVLPQGGWLTAIALLLTAAITVGSLSWLSIQALLNPDVAFWLDQFLPGTSAQTGSGQTQPQSLAQILQGLRQSDQVPGRPLVVAADASHFPLMAVRDVLIPVSTPECPSQQASCQALQELRIYRSLQLPYLLRLFQGTHYYRLLDRTFLDGHTQAQLARLWLQSHQGTDQQQTLPLTRLERYHPAPQPGVWLSLSGLRTAGNTAASYGQILYYHRDQARLSLMLNWASPQGKAPTWQQVTGGGQPELVVNQSVGLDPRFVVYQLHPQTHGVPQLQAIDLAEPAFTNSGYDQGLMLARNGLWPAAVTLLQRAKQQHPHQWSAASQAQLDYIQLHAHITQAQAQQKSASATQRILAYLINGSWTAATQVLQANQSSIGEIRQLLQADTGIVLDRVQASLDVKPDQVDAIAWGAMVISLQQGAIEADRWTRQRAAGNQAAWQYTQSLLRLLNQPPQPDVPILQTSEPATPLVSRSPA